jgi:phosphoribosylamine--glycine ligase
MKVLVVGKGGREHALAKALDESPSVEKVWAIPGSQGMEPDINACGGSDSFEDVFAAYEANSIDLVVVGPEAPLVAGLADQLRAQGVPVFGPDQRGAQLEGSKIVCKEFMTKYKVPTSDYSVVTTVDQTMAEAEKFKPPFVFKADGLAAGKGVFICKTMGELRDAAEEVFVKKSLGSAGDRALLEQFQPGYELSFFVLTNGEGGFVSLPMAQDHKRLMDMDQGPNTGGMGTVAPMKIAESDEQAIIETVVKPTVMGLKEEGFTYRGVVFIGIMMTEQGPQVLEYNIRFGDPETQVLLPLLDGDWGEAFMKIAKGEIPELAWKDLYTACVVMAAENYPASPVKGVKIEGDFSASEKQYFIHAGTKKEKGDWLVNGGRVLNAMGSGSTMKEAIENAYKQSAKVSWPNCQYRKDIGQKALS